MSTDPSEALHQQAHAMDAEADNTEDKPVTHKGLAKIFHDVAERMRGNSPADISAEAEATAATGSAPSGISVQKEDTP